jgi:hypothetical protein
MNFENALCLDVANNESHPRSRPTGDETFIFLRIKTAVNLRILVSCLSTPRRKEGTMKTLNIPSDPKTWAVFLPGVSRN